MPITRLRRLRLCKGRPRTAGTIFVGITVAATVIDVIPNRREAAANSIDVIPNRREAAVRNLLFPYPLRYESTK